MSEAAAGLEARLTDLWSPVLVKEVRQSVRGKAFRATFIATLVLAAVVASLVLVQLGHRGDPSGQGLFMSMHVCLLIALLWLVPNAAYQSMTAEWTENTYDLLVISNLKPRQIVWGKWLSAMVQAALYGAAFLPFLVISFLLRGVDLLAAASAVVFTAALSGALVMIALFLSTFARRKAIQVLLMAGVVAPTVPATFAAIGYGGEILRRPGQMYDDDFVLGASFTLLAIGAVAVFCFLGACASLAHQEENRSSPLRIATLVTLVLGLVLLTVALWMHPEREAASAICMLLMGMVAVMNLFFITEPEAVGRRVVPQFPSSSFGQALTFAFFPGGARGALFFCFQLYAAPGPPPVISTQAQPPTVSRPYRPPHFTLPKK